MCTVPFGRAGRARRIEPERDVVGARVGAALGERLGVRAASSNGDRAVGVGAPAARRRPQRGTIVARARDAPARASAAARRHDHRLRAAVREHVGVVVGRQQRVDRHRHDAGVERAEEGDRPVDRVVHQQQHALLAPQPEARSAAAQRAHALVELAVGERAAVVDVRDLVAARRVAREQVRGEIEPRAGRRLGRLAVIGVLPPWRRLPSLACRPARARCNCIAAMQSVKHYSAVDRCRPRSRASAEVHDRLRCCPAAGARRRADGKDPFLAALGERVRDAARAPRA